MEKDQKIWEDKKQVIINLHSDIKTKKQEVKNELNAKRK